MVKVGEKFVRTEVQFIPASLKVIEHYRETYECRACRKNGTPYMEKSPVPYSPVMHSLASASTIAWLIHQKFELGIHILSDMPGSTFLENPEYLDDYLPWDPMVQGRCR